MFKSDTDNDCTDLPLAGEVEASLGSGAFVINERITGHIPFPNELLKRLRASADHCYVINTRGESMYPTIIGGKDQLLVDSSKKELFDGKLYLIRVEETLAAKRLQKLTQGRIKVISDNKDFESYILDPKQDNFEIIGQILHISRNTA